MRRHRFGVLVSMVLGLAALAAPSASAQDHTMLLGQKASGLIEDDSDVDEIHFFAASGAKVSFKIKARRGESVLPEIVGLTDPGEDERLGEAVVKPNKSGTLVNLKNFIVDETGVWILRIAGGGGSTGIYDLQSKGKPATISLGDGEIVTPGQEVEHTFRADVDTEIQIQVKVAKGEKNLQPFMARLERPDSAGNVNLDSGTRKASKKKDQVKKLILNDNGEYTLVVTGANNTTGLYTVILKPGKKVALDFSVDPPDDGGGGGGDPAPSVSSVTPTSIQLPSDGTSNEGMTVLGSGFQNGADVTFSGDGISNVITNFASSTGLTVTFDLSSSATVGSRNVTVTNPDEQDGTRNSAFTLTAPPSGIDVTSVTPATGTGEGGTQVLIQGVLFDPAATVTFGGIPAIGVNVVDSNSIICSVPPAAVLDATDQTPVDVVVTNPPSDGATLTDGFTYDPSPSQPEISSTVPADSTTGHPRNIDHVVLILSKRPAAGTLISTNFDFFRSAGSGTNDVSSPRVSAVTQGDDPRMIVVTRNSNPSSLSTSSVYLYNVPISLTDVAGNPLDPTPFGGSIYQGAFTTGSGTDSTKPTVNSRLPVQDDSGVDIDVHVVVGFSEAIDPSRLDAGFALMSEGGEVPGTFSMSDDCTEFTFTPDRKLNPDDTYQVQLSSLLRDLSNNTLNATSWDFSTAATDGTAPTQELTVAGLPGDLNGSTTFATGTSNGGSPSGTSNSNFDVQLPQDTFTVDVTFADTGGSGVDTSSFSFTCDKMMGSTAADTNLGSMFTVTPLGATWNVPATHSLSAQTNVTFTVNVDDNDGNSATQQTLTVDVANRNGTPSGKSGDRDPFNSRQSWLLRFDQDIYSISSSAAGNIGNHPNDISVSSSAGSNGTDDFEEDLMLVGLNGSESGTNASTVTNGSETGVNDIVQRMVREAVRGWLNERYGIDYDGTRDADSANIEFLLEGESISIGGTAQASSWNGSSNYSMMTFTGDERPNSSSSAIGRATLDFRNTGQEDDSNSNSAGSGNLGTFATHMIRVRINDFDSTLFPTTFDPLISVNSRGGTAAGDDNLDAVVLDDSFDYSSATSPQKARYDVIMTGIRHYSMYLSFVGAHEIGHSTGLVPDGAPPTGLFGNAHPNNTFIESGDFTTSAHIDTDGGNVMAAASSFRESTQVGSSFGTFGPFNLAYLLRRIIYDE